MVVPDRGRGKGKEEGGALEPIVHPLDMGEDFRHVGVVSPLSGSDFISKNPSTAEPFRLSGDVMMLLGPVEVSTADLALDPRMFMSSAHSLELSRNTG